MNTKTHIASHGFTIIELVAAIGVLSILVALAGPALSGIIASQQIKNAGFDLSAALSNARSEALTRNVSITVAPTSGNWALGWTVTDEGGTVLRRQNAYARISVSGPVRIIFNGDGRPDTTNTPFALTSPEVADENARCVRVRLNGRPSVVKGVCS